MMYQQNPLGCPGGNCANCPNRNACAALGYVSPASETGLSLPTPQPGYSGAGPGLTGLGFSVPTVRSAIEGTKSVLSPFWERNERGCLRAPPILWAGLVLGTDLAYAALTGKKPGIRWVLTKAAAAYLFRKYVKDF